MDPEAFVEETRAPVTVSSACIRTPQCLVPYIKAWKKEEKKKELNISPRDEILIVNVVICVQLSLVVNNSPVSPCLGMSRMFVHVPSKPPSRPVPVPVPPKCLSRLKKNEKPVQSSID